MKDLDEPPLRISEEEGIFRELMKKCWKKEPKERIEFEEILKELEKK